MCYSMFRELIELKILIHEFGIARSVRMFKEQKEFQRLSFSWMHGIMKYLLFMSFIVFVVSYLSSFFQEKVPGVFK